MRYANWDHKLAVYLADCMHKQFVWGSHDCCLFAANAIVAMTGKDFAAAYRGKYTTAAGSLRALKRHGQGDLLSTLHAVLGEPIPLLMAARGDIACVEIDGVLSVGVHYSGVWCVGDAGLVRVNPERVVANWRVA